MQFCKRKGMQNVLKFNLFFLTTIIHIQRSFLLLEIHGRFINHTHVLYVEDFLVAQDTSSTLKNLVSLPVFELRQQFNVD